MTHPLTDEMMCKIHGNRPGYSNPFDEDDMRAAADWQLEQVIEWIRENLSWVEEDGSYRYLNHYECMDQEKVISHLKKAMRPQEDK